MCTCTLANILHKINSKGICTCSTIIATGFNLSIPGNLGNFLKQHQNYSRIATHAVEKPQHFIKNLYVHINIIYNLFIYYLISISIVAIGPSESISSVSQNNFGNIDIKL